MQTWRPSKATSGSSASPTTSSRSSALPIPLSGSSASPIPFRLVVSAFHLLQVNSVFLKLFDYHLWQVRLTSLFWMSLHDTIFMSIYIHNFTLIKHYPWKWIAHPIILIFHRENSHEIKKKKIYRARLIYIYKSNHMKTKYAQPSIGQGFCIKNKN